MQNITSIAVYLYIYNIYIYIHTYIHTYIPNTLWCDFVTVCTTINRWISFCRLGHQASGERCVQSLATSKTLPWLQLSDFVISSNIPDLNLNQLRPDALRAAVVTDLEKHENALNSARSGVEAMMFHSIHVYGTKSCHVHCPWPNFHKNIPFTTPSLIWRLAWPLEVTMKIWWKRPRPWPVPSPLTNKLQKRWKACRSQRPRQRPKLKPHPRETNFWLHLYGCSCLIFGIFLEDRLRRQIDDPVLQLK